MTPAAGQRCRSKDIIEIQMGGKKLPPDKASEKKQSEAATYGLGHRVMPRIRCTGAGNIPVLAEIPAQRVLPLEPRGIASAILPSRSPSRTRSDQILCSDFWRAEPLRSP